MKFCKKEKKNQPFPPTVLLTIISESAAFAKGFANYLLTVGQGSIQVVAAFFLVISKQLYQKNSHQDKVVPLLSWVPITTHQRTTKKTKK